MNYLSKGIKALLISTIVSVAGTTFSFANEDQNVIVSHGISKFGNLKYPSDFEHFDYVNPQAPKGGEISIATYGN
ncbi:MAG: ABC transporter substrate-binding protein, partial [Rhodobacteraceae bacterium]|nr:ABC transporter substrate-binding protein [Paracoccaceae bacterium]